MVEIGDDVARVFDADRQSDHVFGDAGFDLLDDVELLMRRRRGVDHERLRVADVREQREQLEVIDERFRRRRAALDAEGEDCPLTVRQILFGARGRVMVR